MAKTITEDGEIVDVLTHETVAMAPPFFKTPWNHDTDLEAAAVALECKDPSRTQQQFASDADINNILAKFLKTGEPPITTGTPIYQSFEKEFDLQDQMVTGYEVQQAWEALPAAARNILKDPKVFADYVEHCLERGDLDPLRELGLAKAKPTETPTPPGGTPVPGPASGASVAPNGPQ